MFLDHDRSVAPSRTARLRHAGRAATVVAAIGCFGLGGLLAAPEVRVEQGDTLSAIARRTGSSVTAIAQANGIANPNLIHVGQVLAIPPGAQAAPAAPTPGSYTVAPGDTVYAIARRFGTTVEAIQQGNGLTDPNRIRIGTTLTVPGAPPAPPAPPVTPVTAPAAPAATPAATPVATPAVPAGRAVSVSYVVRDGDSPSSIAQRFGVTVTELRNANRLAVGGGIFPGQRLVIPID